MIIDLNSAISHFEDCVRANLLEMPIGQLSEFIAVNIWIKTSIKESSVMLKTQQLQCFATDFQFTLRQIARTRVRLIKLTDEAIEFKPQRVFRVSFD